ncbi:RNA polymerase sigma factor [Streptomyces sp. Ru73]|uniref:RNA polymerase sigma factor n=1 Tax=Streptomyces sp. Ru73 TaxID=2080748 RepID=UPI0011B05D3A|nr:sigma factor-like helix-turn-helix DNA-binding protein [Streptomyces sp. Ru73]
MGFTTRKAQETRKVRKSRRPPQPGSAPGRRKALRRGRTDPAPETGRTGAADGAHAGAPAAAHDEVPDTARAEPPATPTDGPSPTAAFDALYDRHAPTLARQAFLLTGRPALAGESVERGFQLAWQHWPEVARDHDPAGWVRAATHEYALSPWHRFRPVGLRSPVGAPETGRPDPLLAALLRLPAPYRRALLLHDAVGLELPETAAEVEASTPAAAGRLGHAREELARQLPELGLAGAPPDRQREILCERLARLAAAYPVRTAAARAVRTGGERSTRRTTRGAIGLTGLIVALTAGALWASGGDRYVPPPAGPGVPAAGDTRAEHDPQQHP